MKKERNSRKKRRRKAGIGTSHGYDKVQEYKEEGGKKK